MRQFDTFSTSALGPFVDCLSRRGIQADRYLQRHNIPTEVNRSESGKIFKRQAYAFFSDIAREEGMDGFGFLEGDAYTIDDLGALGKATIQAVTLKEAIVTFATLLSAVAEGNHIWLEEGTEFSRIYCRTYDLKRTDHVPDHTSILVLRELIRLVGGPTWQPPLVFFYTEPVAHLKRFFSGLPYTRIEFLHDATGLVFSSSLLSREPAGMLENVPENVLNDTLARPRQAVHEKLSDVLSGLYDHQMYLGIDQIAEILRINRTTLHRSLVREGTHYRQVLERVRFRKAADLLMNTTGSIGDIALLLGYSTSGNFSRAFQRMSGLTPSQYRNTKTE